MNLQEYIAFRMKPLDPDAIDNRRFDTEFQVKLMNDVYKEMELRGYKREEIMKGIHDHIINNLTNLDKKLDKNIQEQKMLNKSPEDIEKMKKILKQRKKMEGVRNYIDGHVNDKYKDSQNND